jgi:hypothetical protein
MSLSSASTLTPPSAPVATGRIVRALPIPIVDQILPSPDGSLIANNQSTSIVLYDLQGHLLAHIGSQSNLFLYGLWLSDSSGLLTWEGECGPGAKLPNPIILVDRQGTPRPTGLKGCDPIPSPDGIWIASERDESNSGPTVIEIVPQAGGSARALVRGPMLNLVALQRDQVVYSAPDGIYTISLTGTNKTKVLPLGPEDDVHQLLFGALRSPDGQVWVLINGRMPILLAQGTIRPAPPDYPIWIGPHEAISLATDNQIMFVDMLTGQVVRETGIHINGSPQAVSGSWFAWTSYTDLAIHLTNFETGADLNLGNELISGDVFSLGNGRFLHHQNGSPINYLIDPSLAGR